MCIIAAKPKGIEIPSEEILTNMWENNPDGAGYMFVENGEVKIRKGFMSYDAFKSSLDKLRERIDCKATPIVFHFRISTHGGINPECCHPFPISKSVKELKARKIKTDIGVVHNGIIHAVTPPKDISDTMEYIKSQLYFIKKINKGFYRDPNFLNLIENAIDSKMCFLDTSGDITTIGKFEVYDGVIYSNSTYSYNPNSYYYGGYGYYGDYWSGWKPSKTKSKTNTNKVEKYRWECPPMYNEMLQTVEIDEGFVVDGTGELIETDFAIDSANNVYTYDWEFGAWQPRLDMSAYNMDGLSIQYDESKALLELVIDEWGYDDYYSDYSLVGEGGEKPTDCDTK